MRVRSSRSTRHCCWGWVRTTTRMTTRPGSSDSTPSTVGSARMIDAKSGSCQMVAVTSRITSVAVPASASKVTGTSTTARDHCCDLLPIRRIVPFGMCQTTPSTSRSRVVRRLTPSTVPVATPASTTSPTPNWSSMSMNMPERKSRTSDCAPNPRATPAMPAPAIRGARLMPSASRIVSTAMDQIVMVIRLRTTAPMVSARWVRRACDIGPVSTSATPPVYRRQLLDSTAEVAHEARGEHARQPHEDPRHQQDDEDADRLRQRVGDLGRVRIAGDAIHRRAQPRLLALRAARVHQSRVVRRRGRRPRPGSWPAHRPVRPPAGRR